MSATPDDLQWTNGVPTRECPSPAVEFLHRRFKRRCRLARAALDVARLVRTQGLGTRNVRGEALVAGEALVLALEALVARLLAEAQAACGSVMNNTWGRCIQIILSQMRAAVR